MLGLRLAIPLHWRTAISPDWRGGHPAAHDLFVKLGDGKSVKLSKLSSKLAYKDKWLDKVPDMAITDIDEWAAVCLGDTTS